MSLSCLIPVLWLLMTFLMLPAAATAQTTQTAIGQAMRLTLEHRLPEAEQVYRDLASSSPAEGYPALARFLYRTGQTTKTEQLLSDPAVGKLSPLLQARVMLAAGHREDAVKILRTEGDAGNRYERISLLANELIASDRKAEAADELSSAIGDSRLKDADRMDLFTQLVQTGDSAALEQTLPSLIDGLMSSSTLSFPSLRELANSGLSAVMASSGYKSFRDRVEGTTTPVNTWLLALVDIKRGDNVGAMERLESVTSTSLTARQKVMLLEELALLQQRHFKKAFDLYMEILPLVPDPDRVRVLAAQAAQRMGSYAQAIALLKKVDRTRIDEPSREIYSHTWVKAVSRTGTPSDLVAAFEREAPGWKWEKLRELANDCFDLLPETEQHQTIKKAIVSRLEETTAPAELYVLLMSCEDQLRSREGIVSAFESYLRVRPDDIAASEEFSDLASVRAYRMAIGGEETTPTEEQKREAADTAAKVLWKLVEAKPYIPNNYAKLMELYRLYGQPDRAKQVPMRLVSGTSATATQIQLAAYILATNGYAGDALPLYERVLRMDPDNPSYRFNYAGCLRRLGRLNEADAVLRDIMRKGAHGRPYNIDDLYETAYQVNEQNQNTDAFINFLESLIDDTSLPGHPEVLVMLGRLMTVHKKPEKAVQFFTAAAHTYPQKHDEAMEGLIEAYVALKDFASAERVVSDLEEQSTTTAAIAASRYDRAYLKSLQGDVDAAVSQWSKLATDMPDQKPAAKGLLAAADLLLQSNRPAESRQYLDRFLAMDFGDADLETAVRELLKQVTAAASQTTAPR